jgi:exosortase/archaeosortase family protein
VHYPPRPRERLATQSMAGPPGRHAAPRTPGLHGSHRTLALAGSIRPPATLGAAATAALPLGLGSPAAHWPWPADLPPGSPGRRVPGGHPPGLRRPVRIAPARPRAHAARPAGRALAPARPTSTPRRIAAISVLAAVAVTLVVFQFTFRIAEATLAATFFRLFTPVLAASRAPNIWFGLGTAHAFGLVITPDCSSSLLLVPLCGLGMLLMIPRRLNVGLVIRALIVAAAVLVVANTLRIGVIALCCRFWGLGVGYQVGHLVLGSLVSIVGIGLSLVLLTAIVASRRGVEFSAALLPRHRRRRS